MPTLRSNTRLGTAVKVNPTNVTLPENLSFFVDCLNPLGAISRTVAEIVACRVEIKRIQKESLEIEQEYKIRDKQVDSAVHLTILALEQRRKNVEKYFAHAEKQLKQQTIYSSKRMKVMDNMLEIVSSSRDLEEKKYAYETIQMMSKDLLASQEAGATSLSILVDASQNSLLQIPRLTNLLNDSSR